MDQVIQPLMQSFDKTLSIPGSKSLSIRALLVASLAHGSSTLHDLLDSEDTRVVIAALKTLGCEIQVKNETLTIRGTQGRYPNAKTNLWCQDSGLACRFLLPLLATMTGEFQLDGTPRLRERPIDDLVAVLTKLGANCNNTALPLTLTTQGLQGGIVNISGTLSSQFLSGLLLAAPLAKKPLKLITTDDLKSAPYVTMTRQVMQAFGVTTQQLNDFEFSVSPQTYQACDYSIEPDLSTASYFFAAAAVSASRITLNNIDRDNCLQGDIRFLDALEQMGCQVSSNQQTTTVIGPSTLQGLVIDMADFSDTFMTLAAIAPFAVTPVLITNIGNTRFKESDRITAVRENLERLNVKVEEGQDWIKIYPSTPQAADLPTYNDHRIAMSFSLIALKTPGIKLLNAECTAKTCPNYFELFETLFDKK